eukprot:TRINITY_DN27906_c0_g1_i1.p1 TRINITY_DN27906_c0_g1~~TRINITY_DN27906_c0_g1_i1.p1  ORF type:complete len:100 (+),score=6.67 TRINITY_DN27906_c0_g1_i1:74-373(+)
MNGYFSPFHPVSMMESLGMPMHIPMSYDPIGQNIRAAFVRALDYRNPNAETTTTEETKTVRATRIAPPSMSSLSAPIPPQIGRAVQQECRDRSRMPSSA